MNTSLGENIYNLVTYGTSGKECYGTGGATPGGKGYNYSCIHSGTIAVNGDLPTTWYNYAAASAGTITGVNNTTKATETICPKGWTLPSYTQMTTLAPKSSGDPTYVSAFAPTVGGQYARTELSNASTSGYYWGSMAGSEVERRHGIFYNNSGLGRNTCGRSYGISIRCVQSS